MTFNEANTVEQMVLDALAVRGPAEPPRPAYGTDTAPARWVYHLLRLKGKGYDVVAR